MASCSGVFSGRNRYTGVLDVSETGTNISGNYSSVHVDHRINETIENGSYSLSNPVTWSWNVDGQTASGSSTYDFRNYNVLVLSVADINIGHNADGSKSIGFSFSDGGTSVIGGASGSGSTPLSTIPRASNVSFSANPVDAGTSVTINTNRASTSFTHIITYQIGSQSGTIGSGVGASVGWVPPLVLQNEFPNATSGNVTITTQTYNGGTLIGTTTASLAVRAPATSVPDFTTITNSEATAGLAANVGAYVQGLTTLALAITGAAGIYNSTISTYKIEILNSSGTILQTINAASGTSTPIQASGTVTLRGTVIDSRGRSTVKTVNITLLAWAPPQFVTPPTVQRALSSGTVDDSGTYLRVNLNATVSSLINTTQRNALNYRISTRVRGTTTWTVKATTTPGGIAFNSFVTVGTYSITTSYDVLVEVYDDFVTSAIIVFVPVGNIFMHWDAGLGVGFGKYRERGTIDVQGDLYLNPDTVTGELGKSYAWGHNHGTAAQRDAFFGTPTVTADIAALANIQPTWFNTDKQWLESYFAPTGTTGLTARGLISTAPAGWYPIAGRLPKASLFIGTGGIGGITANQYCFRGLYCQTPAADHMDGITYDSSTGKLTCPTVGEYRIGWAMAQSTASGPSLVVGASLNSSTNSTTAPAGSIYGVNGMIGGSEVAANSASYTWNVAPANLRRATSSPSDFFNFWFCGGSGTTTIVSFNAAYPGMNFSQFLSLEYVGPSFGPY